MPTECTDWKQRQRRAGIAARRALDADTRAAANAAICARILDIPAVKTAKTLLIYAAFGGEVDLSALAEALPGTAIAYPVCIDDGQMLAAVPAEDGWEIGRYGIRTPVLARARRLPPESLDVVLVPCTAFDAQCRRVGMGKGYYDRYLPRCTHALRIGVAFEVQRVPSAAVEEHDQPLACVVTERTMYTWNN